MKDIGMKLIFSGSDFTDFCLRNYGCFAKYWLLMHLWRNLFIFYFYIYAVDHQDQNITFITLLIDFVC